VSQFRDAGSEVALAKPVLEHRPILLLGAERPIGDDGREHGEDTDERESDDVSTGRPFRQTGRVVGVLFPRFASVRARSESSHDLQSVP
jgi:hypothetical protein